MKRRSRTRRVLKWAGLVGCVLIVIAWGVSTTGVLWFVAESWYVRFGTGFFRAGWQEKPMLVIRVNSGIQIKGWDYDVAPRRTLSSDLGLRWPVLRWARANPRSGKRGRLIVPCWLMLLLAAIPTAWLWHRDRGPWKGYCQNCDYNLTGNVSGVCPECGERI